MSDEETLADVCYRHPNRTSWVLCQRCGRTICPECQIQAPVGVHCPECVAEANGGRGPRWAPAGHAPSNVTPMRKRSPGWVRWLQRALVPDSGRPIVTWVVIAAIVVVFIANLVSGGLVGAWLVVFPGQEPWQLWRFFTSALVSTQLLSVVLNVVFFLIIAPTIERMLGRARFATVLLAGAGVGSAAMMLAGFGAMGLTGAMFGMFAAYFVIIRSMGAPTTQFVILMGVNVVITLVLAPIYVIMLVGGVIGGGGAAALFFWHRDRGTRNAALPYWQIAGGVAAFIALALIRSAVFG